MLPLRYGPIPTTVLVKRAPEGQSRGGWSPHPTKPTGNVRILIASLLFLGALCGCSGGGLLPSGPHSMDQAILRRLVDADARQSGLSPRLVSAIIQVESGGDPAAVSRAGAAGLMQLMPGTAETYGVLNAFDPYENVSGGCRYMHDLLQRYHRNVKLALAAYNAGPGAVDAEHGIPNYPETQAYVARVTAALNSTN